MMTHATSERSKDSPRLGETWLDGLDDEELAAVYRGDPAEARHDRVG